MSNQIKPRPVTHHSKQGMVAQPTALDVAEYLLRKLGPTPCMKLQKLVYYSQAWSLVWEDMPIYKNRIEAWANGPVIRDLYAKHQNAYLVESVDGNPERLSRKDIETIDAVADYYGDKSSQWLSDLIRQEHPWLNAREDLPARERGNEEITLSSMAEYYGSL